MSSDTSNMSVAALVSQERARNDLKYIHELTTSKAWSQYYRPRLLDKIKAQEQKILYGLVEPDQFEKERAILSCLREIEAITTLDATGARSVLGLKKDEIPLFL